MIRLRRMAEPDHFFVFLSCFVRLLFVFCSCFRILPLYLFFQIVRVRCLIGYKSIEREPGTQAEAGDETVEV